MNKLILLLMAFVSLTMANLDVVEAHGKIQRIVFNKTDPHSFHGGECFSLILEALRGKDDLTFDGDHLAGVKINLDNPDSTIWFDEETGCAISDGGEDGFHFKITRNGILIGTAHLADTRTGTQFIIELQR